MSHSKNTVTVVLGTTSALKLQAIKGAFATASTEIGKIVGMPDAEFVFIPTAAKSEVNEQPVGWEETIKGANNRARNALTLAGSEVKPRFVVAIENGAVEVPANGANYYMDVGWAVLNDLETNQQYVSSSTSLSVPFEVIEATRQAGFDTTTIGDVMHSRNPSISTKDPHSSLLGGVMTRVPLLEQAVLSCIGQWIYASQAQKPTSL
jgi:non-canonical (house-cleaning) NTP pyrophosphatase